MKRFAYLLVAAFALCAIAVYMFTEFSKFFHFDGVKLKLGGVAGLVLFVFYIVGGALEYVGASCWVSRRRPPPK